MRSRVPPKLGTWLLTRLSPRNDALAGDLAEQFSHGRSRVWYVRQVVVAMMIGGREEIRRHKAGASRAVLIGLALMWLSGFATRPIDDVTGSWAVGVSNWLLVQDLHELRFWWFRLQLYNLASSIVWCTVLWSIGWIIVRTHPSRSVVMVVALWVPLVIWNAQPAFRLLMHWAALPGYNPTWFYPLLFRSLFSFVIMPFSLLAGGIAAADRHEDPSFA